MEIRDLSGLKRYVSDGIREPHADVTAPSCSSDERKSSVVEPTFSGSRCKLFELAECADCRVFLAYQLQPDQDEPSVWLYHTTTNRWYQLADSFIKYFRMMLVHLGLPLWQICAAGLQLPTWLEQVYLLVGPHLLDSVYPTSGALAENSLWQNGLVNHIDPSIFRGKDHQQQTGAKQKTTSTPSNARKKSSSH